MGAGEDGPAAGDSVLTSLSIAIGLILTVALAIMLGLSDSLQVRAMPAIGATPDSRLAASSPNQPTAELPTLQLPAAPATVTPTSTPEPVQPNAVPVAETVTPAAVAVLAEAQCGNVPAGWILYTVQNGDTLLKLSAVSGATASEISQANCLNLGYLLAGDRIYLPAVPPERPTCGPPIWWVQYRVYRGDTLYSLAVRHGTTVYEIMQANCLVSSRIFAGRFLFLPPIAVAPIATATPTSSPTASPTATPLPAATATQTSTPPSSLTPTATATATPTPSNTPASTGTPTSTPTGTPTGTSTATSTGTPVQTATATNTPTSTPSASSTPTATPSETPTPLPSNTPTATPLPTPTDTPTATATTAGAATATATSTPAPSSKPGDYAG